MRDFGAQINPSTNSLRSKIFSGGWPSPRWKWGLAFRNNSYPFCVWITQLVRVMKNRWSWRAVAKANMRRFFGSRGSGCRQDALLTEETVEPRGSDEELDALAAYRRAKKQGAG